MSMPSLFSRSVSFKTQYLYAWERKTQVRQTLCAIPQDKKRQGGGGRWFGAAARRERKAKEAKRAKQEQKGDRLPQVLVCCDCPHMKSSSSVSSPFSPRASRAASSARLIMSCRSSSVRLLGGLYACENSSMVSMSRTKKKDIFQSTGVSGEREISRAVNFSGCSRESLLFEGRGKRRLKAKRCHYI